MLANASATGGLRGGNIQSSLANFGSNTLATVIQQQLANLAPISTQGQAAATSEGQFGANSAAQVAQLFGAQGQAKAGGILGTLQGQLQQNNGFTGLATDALSALLGLPGGGGAPANDDYAAIASGSGGNSGGILSSLAQAFGKLI